MRIKRLKNIIDVRRWPLSLVIALPILAFIYVHMESHIVYHRVKIGMSSADISNMFGTPERLESTMLFCEKIFQWTGDCPTMRYHEFQFFRTGIDRWVVIGFDEQAVVRFKTLGKL